jgi:hypothetical protein
LRSVLLILIALALAAGPVLAEEPLYTYGPVGSFAPQSERDDVCQYGFQDDQPGGGTTLGQGQSLGILCEGAGVVDKVGFCCEFIVTPGTVDIVIYDDGAEVGRETVTPAVGMNEFDISDVHVSGNACIMLCPNGDFDAATGEDMTNGPFGNTFSSFDCQCTYPSPFWNFWIWAVRGGSTPVEHTTWGKIKARAE